MLAPGDVVDRYTILAALGEGGMGAVYHARDERLERDVALKILRIDDDVEVEGEGAARVLREARMVAALAHPNIITIYEVGEVTLPGATSPTAYLAMELVRGKALRAYVGDPSVDVAQRIAWLVEVADALGAVHALGLVHRDVKPENVMIRDDGRAKVLDFGIARRAHVPVHALSKSAAQVLSTITSNAPTAGTPLYMAPEQMANEPLDGRTDQFAWGVVAYELLAGELPWGEDVAAVRLVAAILAKVPARLDEQALGLAPGIADVIARTLAKSPAARFPTMRDVSAALAPIAPIAEKPATHAKRSLRATPLALVAVALVGVLGAAFALRARAPSSPASSAVAIAPSARAQCRTNVECSRAHDGPSICQRPEGRCVSLATPACTVHADPAALDSDDTVWLGAMLPLSGEEEKRLRGRQNAQASDLARRDFDATIGSKGAQGTLGRARRIGIVACDDVADAAGSARHLVDTVRVPAILGFRSGQELIDLSGDLFGHDVLAVASLSTSPLLTTIPHRDGQPRLVWRTTYGAVQATGAVGAFVPEVIERDLRRGPAPLLDASHPMKIAVVRTKDRDLSPLAEALFDTLRFNGKSALDNGASYRELVWDAAAPDHGAADLAAAADALLGFAPHVIVSTAGDATLVRKVEDLWPRDARHRPRWVELAAMHVDLFPFIGRDRDRRRRFFGVTTSTSTQANARFVLHYNEAFDDKVTRDSSPSSAYDAFYLLAYAVYALGDGAVTGPALSRAMARLVPSTDPTKPTKSVDVGIAGIFDAFNTLRGGGAIDLDGAAGPLDFDLSIGESPFDQDIVCVGIDDRGGANASVESGLVYDARAQKLRGTMKCP